jgi:hypothetical protein
MDSVFITLIFHIGSITAIDRLINRVASNQRAKAYQGKPALPPSLK